MSSRDIKLTKPHATPKNNKITQKKQYNNVFIKTGYRATHKIASTLQGSVYKAINSDGKICALKRASITLSKLGLGFVNKTYYKVNEDIIREAEVLKYLTELNHQKGPNGLTKYLGFLSDDNNYYLLTEFGGKSLLHHVIYYHRLINQGKIELKVWKEHVKILFKQMCIFIDWLHNIARLVHLDISLENMLIKGCQFKDGKFIAHGQIFIIDFGVSKSYICKKSFNNCTKYVGKTGYQAPNVYHRIPFNAKKADVWSLSVVLFMMSIGGSPYILPTETDPHFSNVYNGYVSQWITDAGKLDYVSQSLLDLFLQTLCPEKERLCVEDILTHSYFQE